VREPLVTAPVTIPDWDAVAGGGDAGPQMIFDPENETPAASLRRLLLDLNAACRGRQDLFFGCDGETSPARRARVTRAAELCRACPARAACLEYALAAGPEHGVWAGLDEEQLNAERARALRVRSAA
jgi:WhiB family transcriptional regulator, redox-sensing transcriptional regulator